MHAPPAQVSRGRYRIGLLMFTLPLLFAWLAPYAEQLIPELRIHIIPVLVMGDVIFVASFFVLGEHFWGKVHALFVWEPTPPSDPNETQ